MAQQAAEVGEMVEGTTVELRYEKNTQIPSHHDRVRERMVTVTRHAGSTTELSDGETKYRLHPDGEVYAHKLTWNYSRSVKVGSFLDATPI